MISHAEFTKEIRKRKKYKEEEERRLRNCQVANQNVSLKLSNKKEKKKKRMENQKREKDQQKNSVGSFFDTRHLKYLMLHSKTNFYRRVSIMGIEHGRHLPAFYFFLNINTFFS